MQGVSHDLIKDFAKKLRRRYLYISAGEIWIGAWDKYSNNTLYWVDGTRVLDSYTHWASQEPDGGIGKYVYVHSGSQQTWRRSNWHWKWIHNRWLSYQYLCEAVH